MNDFQGITTVYNSSIPKEIIRHYITLITERNISHPSMFKLMDLRQKIEEGGEINIRAVDIDDPIIIACLSMMNGSASFSGSFDSILEMSLRHIEDLSPSDRPEDVDIRKITNKYYHGHPAKVCKTPNDVEVLFRKVRSGTFNSPHSGKNIRRTDSNS